MRPIRFRGKRKDNGDWVYGHFFAMPPIDGVPRYFIVQRDVSYPVDPATVGQYTGFTDSSLMEVYEDDVVKGFYYEGGKYRRFIGAVEFVAPSFEMSGVKQYAGRSYLLHGRVKVIGNIHEHPHLLKDGVDELGSAFDNGKTITVKGRNTGHYSPKLNLDPLEDDE